MIRLVAFQLKGHDMIKKTVFCFAVLSAGNVLAADKQNADQNKLVVKKFYDLAFTQHKAKEAADLYLNADYIQHNPNVATGRQAFVDFFVPYFKKNPDARSEIKRVVADGSLVVLHVHARTDKHDAGRAVVDIFRVDGGKIVEHWDVMQPIPDKSANSNSMF